MNTSFRKLALLGAIAGALYAHDADAAIKAGKVLNNAYYSTTESGRGLLANFYPKADGSHQFFAAMFTYDGDGNPLWVTIQNNDVLEHQFEFTADVFLVTGGSFGFPWTGPVSAEAVGTATVRLNSCTNVFVSLDMTDASGLPDVELGELQPVGPASNQCVYEDEFDACPDFSEAFGAIPRACRLTGVYHEDITLTNEVTWVLDGLVRIGDDNANSATITIEPGTVIIGAQSATDYLYVSPGSTIIANGTPEAPIVLTSPQDGFDPEFDDPNPGDLGGLVVSGNAPSNACPEAPFNCFSEFDQTQRFGGDDATESSGEISYFQVRYAGIEFQPNAEVNSFTFQGVGSGTTVHHLQAFRGQDDGIEFFGGTVNVKYMVVTEGGDDAVDWDLGYSGNLQYGLVVHGQGFGEDYGIEGASNPDSFDALPRATPTLANYTFLGNGNGDSGILFKDGSGGRIFNTIVDGFPTGCIEWDDAPATYNAAGTPAAPNTDVSAFNSVIVNCATDFVDDGGAPYMVEAFFDSATFTGNLKADPMLDGWMPMPGSPALGGGQSVPDNQFFDNTSYAGGFDGMNDWTEVWTHQPTGGQ